MTPTRILVVGAGGREHALAWKLAGEPGINAVHVAPGSDGIAAEPRVVVHPGIDPLDAEALAALARRVACELVVVGPEAPLANGVADALREAGFPVFGPSRAAARIESSKAFCRDVAAAAGVPMAEGRAFANPAPAREFARELAARRGGTAGVVVKADGLAAGKGVTVCASADEAEAALDEVFAVGTAPGGTPVVVVEERLEGREASVIALCDGTDAVALPVARDHKRLDDGDRGPNTGGMGAYSPLPDVPDDAASAIVDTVHRPILAELVRRGTPFRGALYGGLILTADGPRLLECNARFGDPEAQVVLPRVGVALAPLLLAAARGELRTAADRLGVRDGRVHTLDLAAVGIVVAAAGYPAAPRAGDAIDGLDEAAAAGALVFHAGTRRAEGARFLTAGGRVATIVGRGPDLDVARDRADAAAELVRFDGLQRRRDLARDVPDGLARGIEATVTSTAVSPADPAPAAHAATGAPR